MYWRCTDYREGSSTNSKAFVVLCQSDARLSENDLLQIQRFFVVFYQSGTLKIN